MKKKLILVLLTAMVMALIALAVFAEGETAVQGLVYFEDKSVFSYVNAEASAVSVKIYAALDDAEPLGVYPMTAGENGIWSVTVEGDQQQRYYTFAGTVGEGDFEVPDPTNNADARTRSYIPAFVKYGLVVAGIPVSDQNVADILGEADEGAAVTYDAATNTLTFAMGTKIETEHVGISYTGTQPLIVNLLGDVYITGTGGALRSDASVTFTAQEASVFYAEAKTSGAGIYIGENGVLSLEGMAVVQAKSSKEAGLHLSKGAAVQVGEKNALVVQGGSNATDLKAEDENFTVPMTWITGGKLVPVNGKLGAKVSIGGDPQPYTCEGLADSKKGISIDEETADHSLWLTEGTWQTGMGYVTYVKSDYFPIVELYNANINSTEGAALTLEVEAEIVLRGKNVLTGKTVGLDVTVATIRGNHGMLSANGLKFAEHVVIREGEIELTSKAPLFGEILPDLSQYNGEYTLIISDKKPQEEPAPEDPAPETPDPENPEGETPEGETPEGETPTPETPEGEGPAPEQEQPAVIDNEETDSETEEEEPVLCLYYKLTPQRTHTTDIWVEGVAPDCLSAGTAGYQMCLDCGVYLDADGIEIPAIQLPIGYNNHDFTCEALEGDYHIGTCSRHPTHVYTLPCSGGALVCMKKPICAGCGESYGQRVFHLFSDMFNETDADEVGHWSWCQRPDCNVADEPKAHTGGFISCDDPYICEVCGHEYGGIAGHSYTQKASDQLVSEATCTNAKQYLAQCDHCESISEDVTVAVGKPLPHTYSDAWVTNNAGHWHLCTVCGGTSTPERHTEIVLDQRQATETEPGYTGDVYCQVCDTLIFQGSNIPPLAVATKIDPVVIVAIVALAVSGLGFAGVIVFGIVKKKKAAK